MVDNASDVEKTFNAVMRLVKKRLECVGVEQGGARLPRVPYGEMQLFNRKDFEWLAWESHFVINAALAWLKEQEEFPELKEKCFKERENDDT